MTCLAAFIKNLQAYKAIHWGMQTCMQKEKNFLYISSALHLCLTKSSLISNVFCTSGCGKINRIVSIRKLIVARKTLKFCSAGYEITS